MIKAKTFVYINSFAAQVGHNHHVKNFLNRKIGNKQWTLCNEVLIPEQLKEIASDVINQDFFHGISTYQYTMMQAGGTFINPFLYGLNSDMTLWTDIIHNNTGNFFQNAVYIDIPYELFKEAAKDTIYFVEEDEYNQTSTFIEEITAGINKKYYPATRTQLH